MPNTLALLTLTIFIISTTDQVRVSHHKSPTRTVGNSPDRQGWSRTHSSGSHGSGGLGPLDACNWQLDQRRDASLVHDSVLHLGDMGMGMTAASPNTLYLVGTLGPWSDLGEGMTTASANTSYFWRTRAPSPRFGVHQTSIQRSHDPDM